MSRTEVVEGTSRPTVRLLPLGCAFPVDSHTPAVLHAYLQPDSNMSQQPASWGPFVILHPDPLEPIQEESRYSFPPRRDSRQNKKPSPPRRRAPSKPIPAIRGESYEQQDMYTEVSDEEIIDLYASGWKAPRKAPEHPARAESFETHNSDPTPLTSSWDDSSDDSDTDTLTPNRNKWRKAVNVAKGRLKQMRSKENLLDLPGLRKREGSSSQGSLRSQQQQASTIPLVRISSVSKLERHYGFTSPELQRIGVDASCRVSEKSWSSGRWG